jgi:hypothetical protein
MEHERCATDMRHTSQKVNRGPKKRKRSRAVSATPASEFANKSVAGAA